MSLLELNELRIRYRMRASSVHAVDGISMKIDEGECLGIVGESGCGKSTVGMSIMRLLANNGKIVDGEVRFEDTDLASLSEPAMRKVRGNGIALIPQDPMTSLNPVTKIGTQVAEGLRIHRGASKREGWARALEVLKLVEMPNPEQRLEQYPHQLSGGLRQRVMIAMALVCEPKLLIADEPTTALDVTIQAQILDILDGLRESLNMAVMLITHDMGVIAGRTDRVVVMYAGKKAEEGSTERIFTDMNHPYTQALLASVPRIDALAGGRLASISGLPPDLSKDIVGCRFAPRCQYATNECRENEPALTAADPAGEHTFACYHPVDGPSQEVVIRAKSPAADIVDMERPTYLTVGNLVKDFPLGASSLFSRKGRPVVSAVANVSFEVGEGETFGLVGESGCGKTTIGRLIVGLDQPTSGTIAFAGEDLSLKGTRARKAGALLRQMMFQDPYASLSPRKRVLDIIAEPLEIQGIGTKAIRTKMVGDILGEVGLARDVGNRYPHEFSGGQRQRIGLARALALHPRMVIADEPVSALDVSIQAQILNLMQDLQTKLGLSYILISHDLAVVRYISHRIGVMYLGKLVEVGPSQEVFSEPAHHYSQGLLDAVPVPDVAESRLRRGKQVRGELPSAANPPSGCRFRTRCPAATEICAEVEPQFEQVRPGHVVACHHPLRQTVKITVPAAEATTA
jgi:peptide/nickel transport system ATP-binding protein